MKISIFIVFSWLVLALSVTDGASAQSVPGVSSAYKITEQRARCDHFRDERQVFWGETHVHTAFSIDAGIQDTRNTPVDAYEYAKGKRVGLQPYDKQGRPRRSAQISEPLDFTAVTDHGEALGMVGVCTVPGYRGYNSFFCRSYRNYPKMGFFLMVKLSSISRYLSQQYDLLYFLRRGTDASAGLPSFCGPDAIDCKMAGINRWQQIQQAAEDAYDRSSACSFTSFVAYEWTGNSEVNLHRNVIFRNKNVIPVPLSYVEKPSPELLWEALREGCVNSDSGCDVLAIPHNSNLSGGQMFPTPERVPLSYSRADAELRLRYEPLVEIMQHKGDSECYFGPGVTDELCAFEKLPYALFISRFLPNFKTTPEPSDGYVRTTLLNGLRFRSLMGSNPYELGILAATDSHLGTPGAVEEWQHQGAGGAGKAAWKDLPKGLPDDIEYNPGGIAGVWAEENSRDAIFSALRRRETFGTSGPRIRLRFFGGWGYKQGLCDSSDFARQGYRGGVPMGSILENSSGTADAPHFAVEAVRAVGTVTRPGTPLQRIQIVKGWIDSSGQMHQEVFDIAGDTKGNAHVDPLSCEPRGRGHDRLCQLWQDPGFDAGQQAFYYTRVLENPSCRWSKQICLNQQINCNDPDTIKEGYEQCCDKSYPDSIQERAWSSPVWYYPKAGVSASTR